MNAKTLAVFGKEILDSARDRRSLASALIYSLFGPLVLGMALAALARANAEDGPISLILRELRPFRIYDGASEVHRAAIGRRAFHRNLRP